MQRIHDLERHPRTWLWVAVVLFVAALGTWWRGGFAAAPVRELPRYRAGQAITTNQWVLTPIRTWLADVTPAGLKARDGRRYLIIEAEMTSRMRETSPLASHAFRLSMQGLEGSIRGEPKGTELLRDPSFGANLHPGMTERVAFTWDVLPGATLPGEVELSVVNWTFKERDSLMGASGWFTPEPAAFVRMPIEAQR